MHNKCQCLTKNGKGPRCSRDVTNNGLCDQHQNYKFKYDFIKIERSLIKNKESGKISNNNEISDNISKIKKYITNKPGVYVIIVVKTIELFGNIKMLIEYDINPSCVSDTDILLYISKYDNNIDDNYWKSRIDFYYHPEIYELKKPNDKYYDLFLKTKEMISYLQDNSNINVNNIDEYLDTFSLMRNNAYEINKFYFSEDNFDLIFKYLIETDDQETLLLLLNIIEYNVSKLFSDSLEELFILNNKEIISKLFQKVKFTYININQIISYLIKYKYFDLIFDVLNKNLKINLDERSNDKIIDYESKKISYNNIVNIYLDKQYPTVDIIFKYPYIYIDGRVAPPILKFLIKHKEWKYVTNLLDEIKHKSLNRILFDSDILNYFDDNQNDLKRQFILRLL